MDRADSAFWDDESHLPGHALHRIASAEGSWLVEESGRRLFDAGSGHSCVNLGYANEDLIAAMAESSRRLAYCSPEHHARPVQALADALSERLGGGYRVRYATTGGAANELAIEIARRFWGHQGQPAKRRIIAFERAYHGSTGAASYASGPGILQSPLVDRSAEFIHVAGARDPVAGVSRGLDAIRAGVDAAIAEAGPGTIAAIIVEPIAFAGGVIVPPPGFLAMLAELCRAHDLLLIVDEVINGFGRSGAFFAFQHEAGVRPDIVTMGKGITSAYYPLSATAVDRRIFETFRIPGQAMSKVITMAGHPVGCDIALKVLEIMDRDGLVDRVRANAERHLSHLMALRGTPGLRDVRGKGHMWGLEFDSEAAAEAVDARCLDAGILLLRAGNQIRINPPLVATRQELDFLLRTLVEAVRAAR
ncbi:aminotransferase class III-fold pyridoxal phosphate-dependent enzyme [Roseomonas sp. HJA6]|uniref:Aminotransferase class III-fold pyridoxal phosphate-dependent enzyme n=1 Tax=Roseomonas alba TaxID=2846776 RepID=A0ABS7A5H8_9PROT|nr:aminotransferase class III-fold pyridoxal phosphate-dependent enzyme [Neoroseomonas alba]MBW6397567.1 aminotransferase class III-fold pyridoxal phosphate-dependent enzyme [Neoroseomonas alba]